MASQWIGDCRAYVDLTGCLRNYAQADINLAGQRLGFRNADVVKPLFFRQTGELSQFFMAARPDGNAEFHRFSAGDGSWG